MERKDKERKGLFVQDLAVLDLNGLEEIACLDSQLIDNLTEIKKLIKNEDYSGARHQMTLLIKDTRAHLQMIKDIEVDALLKMSQQAILREVLKSGNTHANMSAVNRDEVIDGTDKTLCMYDFAKEQSDDMVDYCQRVHNGKEEAECAMCTEVMCHKAGVNNV